MVKIIDSKVKTTSGNYERLFGNKDIAYLISQIQSASIRYGNQLEKLIEDSADKKKSLILDIDSFLQKDIVPQKPYLIPKKAIKQSDTIDFLRSEPDFMILDRKKKHCYIIELKLGNNFDTKKSIWRKGIPKKI